MIRRRFFYQETVVFALFKPNLTSDRHVLRLVRKPLNWRVSSWARFFRFRTLVMLYFGRKLKSDNFGIFQAYFGVFWHISGIFWHISAQNMPKYAEICPKYAEIITFQLPTEI